MTFMMVAVGGKSFFFFRKTAYIVCLIWERALMSRLGKKREAL